MVFLTYTCKIHIFSYEHAEQYPRCQFNAAKRADWLGVHSTFVDAMCIIPQASQLRIDVTMCSKSEFCCLLFVGTFICCDKQCRVKHVKFTNRLHT